MVLVEASNNFKDNRCAQLHTLEALATLLLIMGVIIFTVQATSLTPLTSSTANAHIESQMQILGQDILNSLDHAEPGQKSPLKEDIIAWCGNYSTWDGESYRLSPGSEGVLDSNTAHTMKDIAIRRGIAHNIEIAWIQKDGMVRKIPYIYNGEPSDNAVIVTKRLLLSNSDFQDHNIFRERTGIQDADESTDLYNIIDIRLTLWRM